MMKETVISRSVRVMFAGGMAVAMTIAAQPVFAQDAATDAAPVQRVEVTGSAIRTIDAETSVPVTVMRMDDLKKQGISTIEQVMSNISAGQSSQGTSQSVGSGTGGASFADLRGIGANKTLVLLNGRRLANNAYDSSAPDLNMIPFAALERVEVLRDGASSLYGSDAVGGVINFITKKDFTGGVVSLGADSPNGAGGFSNNGNIGYGFGELDKQGFNVFGVLDHQSQHRIAGTERPFNTRYNGGVSSSTFPANYTQGDLSANPAAPDCTAGVNLFPSGTSCKMTTSSFVDYVPKSERTTGLIKGTLKLSDNHELGLEYFNSKSKVQTRVAPVPYGNLYQNSTRPGGAANPFYPTNPALDPAYTSTDDTATTDGLLPGYINLRWRDLPNGSRVSESTNKQQRFVASLTGAVAGWDYETALTYNQNKVSDFLSGYSDGGIITAGVLNGVINPFGAQDAAGLALTDSAALSGVIQNAKGTTTSFDAHASRQVGDWFKSGKESALALGVEANHQKFSSVVNTPFAEKVIASTGTDPYTRNVGSRSVYAAFGELNVPILKNLDITAALRYDKYSDFGSSTNPKVSFRYQPTEMVLLRGSYSTGFRAPSLYDLHSSIAYTNTGGAYDDPINCPGGNAIPGKSSSTSCQQQFQVRTGGNTELEAEKSKNATLGIVLAPVKNLTVGLDFWAIELEHSIQALSQDDIFADPVRYANYFVRNSAGNLAIDGSQCPNPITCGFVDNRQLNLGKIETNGIDVSVKYSLRTKAAGNYSLGMNSTYVHKYEYQNTEGGEWLQNVGVYSGSGTIFKWQNTVNLNWSKDILSAGLSAHYKSGYIDQDPDFRVASYTTFDGFGGVQITKNFGFTLGVRNLFDRDPPLTFQDTTFQAGYDPRYTDPAGRTYYARATYQF